MINFDIENLLPKFLLGDRNGYAMAKAIEAGLKYMSAQVAYGVDLLRNVDTMPEWRLNEYAWEMGAEWYDSTAPIERKRDQAKAINDVYRKIGTKFSVEEAVSAVFGDGNVVKEWFEYGGVPYHYYILITSEDAAVEKRPELLRIIDLVSNERSVLENVYFSGSRGKTEEIHTETAVTGVDERVNAPDVVGYISGGRSPVLSRGVLGKMLIGKTK